MGKFNPSYVGLGELLASPEMQAHMRSRADKIRDAAEAISPIGPENDPHRGEYKASWEVDSGVRDTPTRRAYARVTNPVDYAASVEFGNGRMQGQYTLTRAIDFARE
ncbi:MAG: hypothetical protein ACXVGF_04780 [Blastococcus sp.]